MARTPLHIVTHTAWKADRDDAGNFNEADSACMSSRQPGTSIRETWMSKEMRRVINSRKTADAGKATEKKTINGLAKCMTCEVPKIDPIPRIAHKDKTHRHRKSSNERSTSIGCRTASHYRRTNASAAYSSSSSTSLWPYTSSDSSISSSTSMGRNPHFNPQTQFEQSQAQHDLGVLQVGVWVGDVDSNMADFSFVIDEDEYQSKEAQPGKCWGSILAAEMLFQMRADLECV